MSSSHAPAPRVAQQGSKQSPKTTMLPKAVHDELRMCVALRGYSAIRAGEGKILSIQYKCMEEFYHGKFEHSPSQIQMLVDGQLHYGALYDKKTAPILSKKHKSKKKKASPVQYFLKQSLSCGFSRQFVQNVYITVGDLENKLRRGKAILHGIQLEAMAKKGLREYRKALGFTKDKWNLKNHLPKEFGTTVEDVIEYVRLKMH